jgi:hypothetical protein
MHTHEWNDEDDLVVFRTGITEMESALIRSVLEANGIPCLATGGSYHRGAPTIRVPASCVADAERALEEARKMGERMAEGGE